MNNTHFATYTGGCSSFICGSLKIFVIILCGFAFSEVKAKSSQAVEIRFDPYAQGMEFLYNSQPDYQAAFSCMQISAQSGNVKAQEMLGEMYKEGIGVKRNPVESERWLKVAAQSRVNAAFTTLTTKYIRHESDRDNPIYSNKPNRKPTDPLYAISSNHNGWQIVNDQKINSSAINMDQAEKNIRNPEKLILITALP